MIWGKWVDPNFKFVAFDKEGIVYEYFCFANEEDELEKRLRGKNLDPRRIESYDFAEWRARARKAKDKAVGAFLAGKRPINFNQKIWKELKWHLFEIFHGKCAYCESKPLAVSSGDVEHYRPKAKVDEDPGHPGYYWLAYDETNLLPACESCNRIHAKMTHFPVQGVHARDPEGIQNEQPLLLNPYDLTVDPFQHLEFGEMGEVLPVNSSQMGEASRTYYHLNRAGLSEARRSALAQFKQSWLVLEGILSSFENRHQALRNEIRLGHRPYSAAQLWALDRIVKTTPPVLTT